LLVGRTTVLTMIQKTPNIGWKHKRRQITVGAAGENLSRWKWKLFKSEQQLQAVCVNGGSFTDAWQCSLEQVIKKLQL